MSYPNRTVLRWFMTLSVAVSSPPLSIAAGAPTAVQALRVSPIQPGIACDQVQATDLPKCTIELLKAPGQVGWIVRDPKGKVLRVFLDTNGDRKLDQWRYFKNGEEVYRDIDSNFNGKADAYRWFGAGGDRWGLDPDEDGTVDSWKEGGADRSAAEAKPLVQTVFSDPPKSGVTPKEETFQRLMGELEKLEKASGSTARPEEQARLTSQRADVLEQIAEQAATPEERSNWLRQLADMLSAAIQSGGYPEGSKRLTVLAGKLQGNGQDGDLVAHIRFQQLNSDYIQTMQSPNVDYEKAQIAWIAALEKFIGESGERPAAAEAMFQLAMAHEFAGQEDKAKIWYARLAKEFKSSPSGKRATGAISRLESIGKEIAVGGRDLTGKEVRLDQYRGKAVLLHYWATWSEFCKKDLAVLKELLTKSDASSLQVVSISVDHRREDVAAYVEQNRLSWTHIFEEGGLEGRPASDLGIVNVPTMILIDKEGKVVHRDVKAADLKRELERLK